MDTMKRLYTSMVRPHLEYSNTVTYPRLEKDKKLLERVQRRTTKLIPGFKDLPFEERLKRMKLPGLAYRRARGDMIEVYKITHGHYSVGEDLLPMAENSFTQGLIFKLCYSRTATKTVFLKQSDGCME